MLPLTRRQRRAAARLPPKSTSATPPVMSRTRGDILLPVVDDMRGTAAAGAFRLFRRADRRDHSRPGPGGELHRVMTDRSGAASHQKRTGPATNTERCAVIPGTPSVAPSAK